MKSYIMNISNIFEKKNKEVVKFDNLTAILQLKKLSYLLGNIDDIQVNKNNKKKHNSLVRLKSFRKSMESKNSFDLSSLSDEQFSVNLSDQDNSLNNHKNPPSKFKNELEIIIEEKNESYNTNSKQISNNINTLTFSSK